MERRDELDVLFRYFGGLRPGDTFYHPLQYVLEHLNTLATVSIHDLAAASFVSAATISRMCRDLGYQTYQDFKTQVYIAYHNAMQQENANSALRIPRGDTESIDAAMVLNYLDLCRAGLDFAEGFVKGKYFEEHLDIMRKAQQVFVLSSTAHEVTSLQRKLILSRKRFVMLYGPIPEIAEQCRSMLDESEEVCCLFFVHSREEYDDFRPFIESVRTKGVSAIMVRPHSIHAGVDYPLLDRAITYPDVGSLSDETFFSSYIASLAIAL